MRRTSSHRATILASLTAILWGACAGGPPANEVPEEALSKTGATPIRVDVGGARITIESRADSGPERGESDVKILAINEVPSGPRGTVPAELRAAVTAANEAWVRASKSLRRADLEPHFAREALESHDKALQIGREEDFYLDSELVSIEYESARVASENDTAVVVTVEDWKTVVRRVGSGECLLRSTYRNGRLTYHLAKLGSVWRIVKVDKDTNNPRGEPSDCTP